MELTIDYQPILAAFAQIFFGTIVNVARMVPLFLKSSGGVLAAFLVVEVCLVAWIEMTEDQESADRRIFTEYFLEDFDGNFRRQELMEDGVDIEEYESAWAENMYRAERDFLTEEQELGFWMESQQGRYVYTDADVPYMDDEEDQGW